MKKFNIYALLVGITLCSCDKNDNEYDATGVFEATEVTVSAMSTGQILNLDIEEGMDVKQGDRLGMIDSQQSQLMKNQLAANISATDSRRLSPDRQVASLRQQLENLQRERQRFASLLEKDATTQKQVDDIDYQINVLRRQIDAQTEQLSSQNRSLISQSQSISAQIAALDDQISKSLITSPIDGVILNKYMEPGEFATAGRPLFKVADLSHLILRAYITAPQLTGLKIGDKVRVYADDGADGAREYEGVVSWISDKAEFTPKTIQTRDERANLVYAIKISVENDGLIKRGMYGNIRFGE